MQKGGRGGLYAPTERKLPASVIAILLIDPGMVDMLLFQNKKSGLFRNLGMMYGHVFH